MPILSQQDGWTACEDEMPDSETTVLIANNNWPSDPVWFGFHDGEIWRAADAMPLASAADSGESDAAPTHWMQLPEPPTVEGR